MRSVRKKITITRKWQNNKRTSHKPNNVQSTYTYVQVHWKFVRFLRCNFIAHFDASATFNPNLYPNYVALQWNKANIFLSCEWKRLKYWIRNNFRILKFIDRTFFCLVYNYKLISLKWINCSIVHSFDLETSILFKPYISFNRWAIPYKMRSIDSANAGRISAVISRQLTFKNLFIIAPSSGSPLNKLSRCTEAPPILNSTLISATRLLFSASLSDASFFFIVKVASTSARKGKKIVLWQILNH